HVTAQAKEDDRSRLRNLPAEASTVISSSKDRPAIPKSISLRDRMVRILRRQRLLGAPFRRRDDWCFRRHEAEINDRRIPFIEEILPKNGIGAELGVFKGYFSPLLLHHTQARVLHLIDPWYLLCGEWSWGGGKRSTVDA